LTILHAIINESNVENSGEPLIIHEESPSGFYKVPSAKIIKFFRSENRY